MCGCSEQEVLEHISGLVNRHSKNKMCKINVYFVHITNISSIVRKRIFLDIHGDPKGVIGQLMTGQNIHFCLSNKTDSFWEIGNFINFGQIDNLGRFFECQSYTTQYSKVLTFASESWIVLLLITVQIKCSCSIQKRLYVTCYRTLKMQWFEYFSFLTFSKYFPPHPTFQIWKTSFFSLPSTGHRPRIFNTINTFKKNLFDSEWPPFWWTFSSLKTEFKKKIGTSNFKPCPWRGLFPSMGIWYLGSRKPLYYYVTIFEWPHEKQRQLK